MGPGGNDSGRLGIDSLYIAVRMVRLSLVVSNFSLQQEIEAKRRFNKECFGM